MSAAVRPTSAVLRRARHVPVTHYLAQRWQTNTAQAQSYEELLSGLEAEFPARNRAPSRTKQIDDGYRSPLNRGQPSEKDYASSDTASLPAVESSETETRTNTEKKSTPKPAPQWKKTLKSNHEFVKPPFQKQPTAYSEDTQKSRRIPPPTFKPFSPPTTTQDVPERPLIRKLWRVPTMRDQAQVLDEAEFPQDQPDIPLPPKSAAAPDSNLTTRTDVLKSQKHHAPIDIPTPELRGPQSLAASFSPSESIKLKLPHPSTKQIVPLRFDNIFLRDLCDCTECIHTSTRQKRFDSTDIPTNITIRSVKYNRKDVVISWKHDISGFGPDHRTTLSHDILWRAWRGPVNTAYKAGKWAWNTADFEAQMVDYDYNSYMSDEKVLFKLLRQLHTLGLVFIKNVPESESAVIDTANRIGPLKNTFYGDTWDVRSVSKAKNVAYTNDHLGFHMDLLYMQQPPRLQLLHCLRASEQGGISLFSDAFRAVNQLHDMDPDAFEALTELPVNFHYDNDNHNYFRSHRTFQLREGFPKPQKDDKMVHKWLEAVNWAPPFQTHFSHPDGNASLAQSMRRWHEAAQLFRNLIEMKTSIYKRQMAPGECVIFDNRRVLHARTAFGGGERWLRGAYLDDDPYLSKIRVLERSFGNIQDRSWLKPMRRT